MFGGDSRFDGEQFETASIQLSRGTEHRKRLEPTDHLVVVIPRRFKARPAQLVGDVGGGQTLTFAGGVASLEQIGSEKADVALDLASSDAADCRWLRLPQQRESQ